MKTLSNLNGVPIKYKRIDSEKANPKNVKLDKADKKTIEIIIGKAIDKSSFILKDKEVKDFFKNKKHYTVGGK